VLGRLCFSGERRGPVRRVSSSPQVVSPRVKPEMVAIFPPRWFLSSACFPELWPFPQSKPRGLNSYPSVLMIHEADALPSGNAPGKRVGGGGCWGGCFADARREFTFFSDFYLSLTTQGGRIPSSKTFLIQTSDVSFGKNATPFQWLLPGPLFASSPLLLDVEESSFLA